MSPPSDHAGFPPRGKSLRLWSIASAAACLLLLAGYAVLRPEGGPAADSFVVATGRDLSDTGIYAQLIEEFNAGRTENEPRAELVEIGGGADLQRAEMVRWLQDGEVRYDVLNIDNQWAAEFARAGWIDSAEADVDTGPFLERPLAAVSYNGVAQAVPFITDVGLLYYRSDLLDSEDLEGRSWQDTFRVLLERAEVEDGAEYGYAGQFGPYEGFTVNLLEVLRGHGGIPVDPEMRVSLAPRPERDGVELIASALQDGSIPPGAVEETEAESFHRFASGEVVAMRNWPVWYDRLALYPGVSPARGGDAFVGEAETEGEGNGGGEIEFDVMPLPPSSAVLGGQSLALNSDTPFRDDAVELIGFLTAPEQQRRLFYCGGYAPVRADAYTGAVEGVCPGESGQPGRTEVTERRGGYSALLLDEIGRAGLRPVSPYYTRFTQVFHSELGRLVTAGAPEPEELERVEGLLQRALDGG